jgi:hypothetical protein
MKLAAVEAIATGFADADVRYLVVGGLAVAAHGYGRLTVDLDVVLQLKPENVLRAMAVLTSLGYRPSVPVRPEQFADPAVRDAWIREKGMVVFQMVSRVHRDTPIDLFVNEPFDFDVEYAEALIAPLAPGVVVRCARIETLIRMKRVAGRPKDLEDIRQLELLRDGPSRD